MRGQDVVYQPGGSLLYEADSKLVDRVLDIRGYRHNLGLISQIADLISPAIIRFHLNDHSYPLHIADNRTFTEQDAGGVEINRLRADLKYATCDVSVH